jgi:MFS family permease
VGGHQHEFGFSEVVLTLVYATYAVGNLVALFFLGRVSDQIGRRRTSLPALALGAATSITFLSQTPRRGCLLAAR